MGAHVSLQVSLGENCSLMKPRKHCEQDADASSIKCIQEAEFLVLSSIAVREQHKATLCALISAVTVQKLPAASSEEIRDRIMKPQKSTKDKTNRTVSEIAEREELYVLGDLLLLTRAASVDVVESIQKWREIVHQEVPRPYIYEHENYLLNMCEDLDFLDQVEDLVEWLGFRLVRNPFIVNESLDDIVSARLGLRVHDARSLKYWNSASWQRNKQLAVRQKTVPNNSKLMTSKSRRGSKARWKEQSPPRPLVKPLASIRPEDDVVDGSRITNAMKILLDEESFHGRLRAFKSAQEYIDRGPSKFGHDDDNNPAPLTVYEAIAAVNSKLRLVEYQSSLLRWEHAQVERTCQDLVNQVKWTELRRGWDNSKVHRVRHCRELYRQAVLKAYAKLSAQLHDCISVLKCEEDRFRDAQNKYKERISELKREKDKQREARHNKKQQVDAARREYNRKMAKERSGKHLRKEKKTKQPKPELNWESTNGGSSADIEREARLIIVRKSSRHVRNTVSPGANTQLEEKRQRSIYQKRARWEKQDRIAKEKELELDRRRAENIAMKCEDTLAQVVEQDSRRKTRLRERKAKRDQQAMCAIFKCMHEMNGKRFLVAIFTRLARGYDLDGLRIVAYDPSSSASFSLVMTLHEFNCLGYGRTSDGLGAFCKWLCLLYEKRRRQFRLVWSGSPCPPPLRVRESDQTLVCIHKEGVKMRHAVAYNFSLVGLYLRTDNPSIVRFVMSSWHAQDCVLGEYALAAHSLILGSDLDLKWKSPEHAMIVWKHRADDIISEDIHSSHSINIATRSISELSARVYSSEVFVNRTRYLLHLYDSGQTQYTIELTPILKSSKQDTIPLRHPVNSSIIIFKREVNPYNIPLSSSNFAELISLIRFEQTFTPPEHEGRFENDSQVDRLQWKATISSKWARTLAKYVRVIRLAKYACKIGGIFCFVAIFVVQQKTKFRAHLLLELTWLSATQSSSCSVGGAVTRQSLRIALSDYLRCGNALSRLTFGLGYGDSMNEHECSACWMYAAARARLYENENVLDKMPFGDSSSCFNCVLIQYRRLKAIRELLAHAGHIPPQSLEFVYHGYCEGCAMLVSPIVLVVGSMVSITYTWLQPLLEHYFASYDCTNDGFLHFIEEEQHHAIEQDSIQIREAVLQTLERDRVAVLFNADCGITVASANSFVHELHWWLFPDHCDLPCHVAFVVADQNYNADGINSFVQNTRAVHRDYDLLESLEALDNLVHQIAKLDPVHLDDGDEEERDRASAFDAYLVAEAVLVEAIRVLLHQDMSWQKPRKIVGASSWSTACNFLLNPAQLSTGLQAVNPLKVNVAAAEVLEAYFAHAKWPHNYSDVRPFFYELLGYMLHIQHVRQILALRSGSLQNSQTRRIAIDDVTDTTHDSLAKNTSVIECSFTNTSQTAIGS